MTLIAWIYASAIGLFGAIAIFLFARETLGTNMIASFLLALTAGIPLVGNIFSAYAAVQVWSWSWELALLVFIVSVFAVSKTAHWLHERRR
jgi:hypothetical protein